jgi:hypothetical protein
LAHGELIHVFAVHVAVQNERIVASGIYYYHSENISESRLAFRQAVKEPMYEQGDNRGVREVFGLEGDEALNQPLGSLITQADRCIAFPNLYQHQVQPFELLDKSKKGERKILVFFLCDPAEPVVSTANVPPQQLSWFKHSGESSTHRRALREATPLIDDLAAIVCDHLTDDLGVLSDEQAKADREVLMSERKFFVGKNNEVLFERSVGRYTRMRRACWPPNANSELTRCCACCVSLFSCLQRILPVRALSASCAAACPTLAGYCCMRGFFVFPSSDLFFDFFAFLPFAEGRCFLVLGSGCRCFGLLLWPFVAVSVREESKGRCMLLCACACLLAPVLLRRPLLTCLPCLCSALSFAPLSGHVARLTWREQHRHTNNRTTATHMASPQAASAAASSNGSGDTPAAGTLPPAFTRAASGSVNGGNGGPVASSLFAQLQAAQSSSGGTQAAAALLLAKSKELLGLSEGDAGAAGAAASAAASDSASAASLVDAASALVPLDQATKDRLWKEGEELRGFSEMLLASEGGQAVADVWQSLAERYNAEGSGLQNEAVNLWTSLYHSQEAQELTDTSADLFAQWRAYANTTDGLKLLEQSGEALKAQSGVLGQLLANLTMSAVGTASGSDSALSPTNADSSPSARSSGAPGSISSAASTGAGATPSPSPSVASDTTLVHKDALMKTTTKVTAALADDEDVKQLLGRASGLLQSFSGQDDPSVSKSGGSRSKSPSRSKSASSKAGAGVPDPTSPFRSSEADVAGDMTSTALKTGETYLKSLRESETGHVLLAKATVLLQQNKDLLRPEALTSFSGSLASDADARQSFVTRVKDVALDFLLSYLPTVVVPPIAGQTESGDISYEISNIDLGGFQVDSNHVQVEITGERIEVIARRIRCTMKNLLWKYQKNSFPRISGSGTADADASDMDFVLKLKLAYPGVKDAAQTQSQTPAQPAAKGDQKKSGQKLEVPAQPKGQQQQQQPKSAAAGAAASSAASASAAASAAPAASASPALSATPSSGPPSPAKSVGETILATVSTDLGQPTLVLHSCQLRLHTFQLTMSSGRFKSIYNRLIALFNDKVKEYLQATLNEEIQAKSAYLLETLNALAKDYLPMLQRIMIKATTAAMQEDEPAAAAAAAASASAMLSPNSASASEARSAPSVSLSPPAEAAKPAAAAASKPK